MKKKAGSSKLLPFFIAIAIAKKSTNRASGNVKFGLFRVKRIKFRNATRMVGHAK